MERVVYLWVVWVMFVMRKGHLFCNHLLTPGSYCSAACPAWPWVLFGICLVIQHQLAALMMSKFCHACDLEDLTFYIFLNSDLGLFWFTKHTDLYKAQKTLAASLHPIRLWTSLRLPWVKTQVLWFFFFFNHLSTMSLCWQAECQAPLRQLILFPGYSLESQAQLTFFVILPNLLGGPIISHSLQLRLREIGCWKQWPTPILKLPKSFSSFSALWPNFTNSLSSVL